MHLSWGLVTLLAASPALTSAIPSPSSRTTIPLTRRRKHVDNRGLVNTTELITQIKRTQRKLNRGFEAYHRNTGKPHPARSETIQPRHTGSVPLTDADHETLWFGNIQVGSPPHLFTVDFDTGSSDLFLPGPKCGAGCSGHQIYNPEDSSTSEDQLQTASLKFGDGSSIKCEVFTDTVTIAGLTARNQAVGAATHYSREFEIDESPPDGLMGMAFSEVSDFARPTVFESLIAQNVTAAPEFSFKLATSGSELFLGGVDNSKFTGHFTYANVTRKAFWEVGLDSLDVNGNQIMSNLSAIIDTGTTGIVGPTKQVERFYQAIPGAVNASATVGDGLFTFPCRSVPSISLKFSGRQFSLSSESFNLGPVSANSSHCIGAVTALRDAPGLILGDSFLVNVYTKFDVGHLRVGFAELA